MAVCLPSLLPADVPPAEGITFPDSEASRRARSNGSRAIADFGFACPLRLCSLLAMALVVELPEQKSQLAFNRARWEEVCADPDLARHRGMVETNRFGQVIMSPPPKKNHGQRQMAIGQSLGELLPDGYVTSESPISTSDGVKGADVTWASDEREAQNPESIYEVAPEICVEVLSPSNSEQEIAEKRALYFDAGAEEVWICGTDAKMRFFAKAHPSIALANSLICPAFPDEISR